MNRLSRAWRELRRPDPPYPGDELQPRWLYPGFHDIARTLDEINKTLVRMERRKRRARIVNCQHPELHDDVDIGRIA